MANSSKTRKRDAQELPDFMTVPELAELLRCSQHTIRNWVREGVLPAPMAPHNRQGVRWLWSRREVARWIATRWPRVQPRLKHGRRPGKGVRRG